MGCKRKKNKKINKYKRSTKLRRTGNTEKSTIFNNLISKYNIGKTNKYSKFKKTNKNKFDNKTNSKINFLEDLEKTKIL